MERSDLGTGNDTLVAQNVADMAGFDGFDNANGWADGTYNLAAGGAGAAASIGCRWRGGGCSRKQRLGCGHGRGLEWRARVRGL